MKKCILLVLLQVMSCMALAETLVITCPRPANDNDNRSHYHINLLALALEKTIDEGPYRIERAEIFMTQARAIQSVKQDKLVNVMWTMTTKEREQELLPVRIPILKGLLGHRLLLIRPQDQAKFSAVKQHQDLAKLTAGQGADWPDTHILIANRLPVVTGNNYLGLFKMLSQERFDYFPRGVHEAWAEVVNYPDLAVEESILLQYPAPTFFFVSNQNVALQQRLERGLRMALKDGSFDTLLYNNPEMSEAFEKSKMGQRKLFRLKNPLLSAQTQALLDDPLYWYQPGDE